jgi:hypothetical protein
VFIDARADLCPARLLGVGWPVAVVDGTRFVVPLRMRITAVLTDPTVKILGRLRARATDRCP